MPEIAGLRLLDASGNPLTDASANPIQEASLPVFVGAGQVLFAQLGAGLGGFWGDLIASIVSGVVDAVLGGGGETNTDLREQLDLIRDDLENTAKNPANIATNVKTVVDQFPLDLSGAGGLTQEEHDWLLSRENLGTADVASAVGGMSISTLNTRNNADAMDFSLLMEYIARYLTWQAGFEGIPLPGNPYWRVCGYDMFNTQTWVGTWPGGPNYTNPPVFDMSLIQYGDTLKSFIEREYSGTDIVFEGPDEFPAGTQAIIRVGEPNDSAWFRCTLTDADIAACWPQLSQSYPEDPANIVVNVDVPGAAPIWPGLDNVTVGSSAALSDGLVIEGPMDGLLFTIDSASANKGKYGFGSVSSWQHVGAVIFGTDRGDYERAQSFGIDTEVVVPHTMKVADSAIIRFNGGFTGTVRPWTKTT